MAIVSILTYPLPFLLVLSLLVFVHESGHFLVARLLRVPVSTFSVGFGRELIGFTDRWNTRWKLSLIPFGGYVKMKGEEGAVAQPPASAGKSALPKDRSGLFSGKPIWVRLAVVLGGPLANILFTILVFTILIARDGEAFTPPIIIGIMPNSAAEAAGFQPDGRVVSVDGHPIVRSEDFSEIVLLHPGRPLDVAVEADGVTRHIIVAPRMMPTDVKNSESPKVPRVGLRFPDTSEKVYPSSISAIWRGARQTLFYAEEEFLSLLQTMTGIRPSAQIGGVMSVAEASHASADSGMKSFLILMAHLSLGLGVMNLLPIPVLDGGYIVFFVVEAMFGKRAGLAVQTYSLYFGFGLIVMVAMLALSHDLSHHFAAHTG